MNNWKNLFLQRCIIGAFCDNLYVIEAVGFCPDRVKIAFNQAGRHQIKFIITLFFAGFSAAQVSVIMGRPSSGSVRTLKSRMRDVIRQSNATDKRLFLDLMA